MNWHNFSAPLSTLQEKDKAKRFPFAFAIVDALSDLDRSLQELAGKVTPYQGQKYNVLVLQVPRNINVLAGAHVHHPNGEFLLGLPAILYFQDSGKSLDDLIAVAGAPGKRKFAEIAALFFEHENKGTWRAFLALTGLGFGTGPKKQRRNFLFQEIGGMGEE